MSLSKTPTRFILTAMLSIAGSFSLPIPAYAGGPWSKHVVDPDGQGDFPTIQQAVEAAALADTICVYPGVYEEDVVVQDKWLHIVSRDGKEVTEIRSLQWTAENGTEYDGSLTGVTIRDTCAVVNLNSRLTFDECCFSSFLTGTGYATSFGGLVIKNSDLLGSADLDYFGASSVRIISSFGRGDFSFSGDETTATVDQCELEEGSLRISSWLGVSLSNSVVRDLTTVFVGANGDSFGEIRNTELTDVTEVSTIAKDARFTNNTLVRCGSTEVRSSSIDGEEESARASGNRFVDGTGGLELSSFLYLSATGNMLIRCGAGIEFASFPEAWPGQPHTIADNTIVGCAGPGIRLGIGDTDEYVVSNNLVVDCETGIDIDPLNAAGTISCNDSWANGGGNWIGVADPTGVDGNISADPRFCNPMFDEYFLQEGSPCAADQQPVCGKIGASGVGCGEASSVADETAPDQTTRTSLGAQMSNPFVRLPNPLCGGSVVCLRVPDLANARLQVVGVDGRRVLGMENISFTGEWRGIWGAGHVSPVSGLYIWKVTTGSNVFLKKVVAVP